jgi:hypothetical protein
MKRSTALATLILTLLLGLAVAGPMPASAQSDSVRYHRGDRPAFLDLVRLRATNGQHRVRMELQVRDLRKRGTFVLQVLDDGDARGTTIRVQQRGGEPRMRIRHEKEGGDSAPLVRCPQARVRWQPAADRIVVGLPQRCLRWYFGIPEAWRFAGLSYANVDGELVYDRGRPLLVGRG